MKTHIKKRLLLLTTFLFLFLIKGIIAFAEIPENEELLQAQALLSQSYEKTTIIKSEHELIRNLIIKNKITTFQLKEHLIMLSNQLEPELKLKGYSTTQIYEIKKYNANIDPMEFIAASSEAKLVFQFGLGGSDNTRKRVRIAYDIKWTSPPFFCFTDSYGIGWVAADANSHELATRIISATGVGSIYSIDGSKFIGNRNVTIDSNTAGVVRGTIAIGSASGNYVKHMGGLIIVETQSGSYNMDTLQLFVAYAHTIPSIHIDGGVTIQFKKVGPTISFYPTLKQDMLIQGNATFKYSAQWIKTLYHY